MREIIMDFCISRGQDQNHIVFINRMEQLRGQFIYPWLGGNSHSVTQNVVSDSRNQGHQQPYVMVVPAPVQQVNDGYNNYTRGASCVLGALQITMALILIGLNTGGFFSLTYHTWLMSTGIWTAPFYILAGSFGIAAGCHPSKCRVNTTLVMSIISCVTVIFIALQFATSVIMSCYRRRYCNLEINVTLMALFLVFGICEFIFALAQSILCCQACCCGHPVQPSQAVVYQTGDFVARFNQGPTQTSQNATERCGTYLTPVRGATGGATSGTPYLESTGATYKDINHYTFIE